MSLTKQKAFQVWGSGGGEAPGTKSNTEMGVGRVGGGSWLQLAHHSLSPSVPPPLLPGAVPGSLFISEGNFQTRKRVESRSVLIRRYLCVLWISCPVELSAGMAVF